MKSLKEFLNPWIHPDTVDRLLVIITAIVVIVLILFYAKRALNKHLDDPDKRYKAKKVSNIFAYVLIIIAVLFVYSDKLGGIGVAVGLAGAGIAFALSEVITSFAGWISIMLTNQVKVGQRVKIGELKGDIIDIEVFKTTIMEIGDWVNGDLYNGRITTVSNSFVFKSPIQNYSADYPFLWDEINIPLRTNSDFKIARQVFHDVTMEVCGGYAKDSSAVWNKMKDKYRIENAQVDPMITMKFDENWMTFTIRYVVDYTKRRGTKDILYTRILEEINKRNDVLMIATAAMEIATVPNAPDDHE